MNVIQGLRIDGTANAALQLVRGRILNRAQSMLIGLTVTNLGIMQSGLDPIQHGEMMRCALIAGAGTIGASGAIQLKKGIKQKSIPEIIKGAVSLATGVAGSVIAYSLDSRILVAAHQASIFGLSSSLIGVLGAQEITKGNYLSGIGKMALGIAGVASSVCYVYNSCFQTTTHAEPVQNPLPFIESHQEEIESILAKIEDAKDFSRGHVIVGKWRMLGYGSAKTAFTHEELPGWTVKIPNSEYCAEEIMEHHTNLENIRGIASNFDRILLPKSHLYQTSKGAVLVEEFFELIMYRAQKDQLVAGMQLYDFAKIVGLCDFKPEIIHNAGILAGSSPPSMAIIDFDCRYMTPKLL